MFWRKKQVQAVPVSVGTATTSGVATEVPKTEALPKQKVEKTKAEKLPGPKMIPGLVEKHLITEYKMDADLVRILKIVVHKHPQTEKAFDCRIFDSAEAEVREINVHDYNTLTEHPELVLYEGWFDEDAKKVEMTEKRRVSLDAPLFTEDEILQKIEALSEPGSTVFFYQARGPAFGGPLGRGAAIVQLKPEQEKGKKYIVYTANVIGTELADKKSKLFDSDKTKEIAKWIKEAHHKRIC